MEANEIFKTKEKDSTNWNRLKKKYCEFFVKIKKIWDESKFTGKIDVYESLFRWEDKR